MPTTPSPLLTWTKFTPDLLDIVVGRPSTGLCVVQDYDTEELHVETQASRQWRVGTDDNPPEGCVLLDEELLHSAWFLLPLDQHYREETMTLTAEGAVNLANDLNRSIAYVHHHAAGSD